MTVTIEFDVPARMRDGVMLRADVYRPAGDAPWPTLLMRTPYNKGSAAERVWSGLDPMEAARRGFLVVIQDTRGRFASEGEWAPLRFERQDGYDTIEWAARLPGSNGRVGTYGGSYCGNTQWMAAIDAPPSLAAISSLMTWAEPTDGLFSRGGAIELGLLEAWSLLCGVDHLARLNGDDYSHAAVGAAVDDWDELPEQGYWELPVQQMTTVRRHGIPDLGSISALEDPAVADWCRVAGRQSHVKAPSLHTGGWYDCFLQGTLDNYQATVAAGREARLMVGPWSHEQFGDPSFGLRSARDAWPAHTEGTWNDVQLAWFRRHLASAAEPETAGSAVRYFVMGRNEWRDQQSWPPDATNQRWFLAANGSLTTTPPTDDSTPDSFTYDPQNPVPTTGGHLVMWPGYPAGAIDQSLIEARDDVLVYTSEPLEQDLEVTGRVRVALSAQSSAVSTDWVARLCDVHPDGSSRNVCDGITRVGEGARQPAVHEIDLWSTSIVFLRGHRLRLQVTSSCFPRWDRNLNTGDRRSTKHERARQLIYRSADRASYIELPVIR